MKFYRLTYEDAKGFVFNEWVPDSVAAIAAGARGNLTGLRLLATDLVEIPSDPAGLLAWLNDTPNTPFMRSAANV